MKFVPIKEIAHDYACSGTSVPDTFLLAAFLAGAEAERRACAVIADHGFLYSEIKYPKYATKHNDHLKMQKEKIAEAIWERGIG